MRFVLLLLSFMTVLSKPEAQEYFERPIANYVWLFNGSRFDFNYEPVFISADDQPMPLEGTNASICDDYGELLVYTNGIYIANALGDTLENSFYINPGLYAEERVDNGFVLPQMAIFLRSGTGQKYFLFHENVVRLEESNAYNDVFQTYNFSQSIISLDGTELTLENQNDTLLLDTLALGQLTASRSGDGSSWWILVPKNYSNTYHKFSLSGDHVTYSGVTSTGMALQSGVGGAKFSPDGTKYAKLDLVGVDLHTVSIYDFDRCTGDLSNPIHIPFEGNIFVGGLAFSGNSRFLYVSLFGNLEQYDLEAEDIEASKVVLTPDGQAFLDGWGYYMTQLAPDGKIYISHQGTQDSIHVINYPNRKGLDCGFEHLGIALPSNTFRTMPNFPHYGLGPWDGTPCDTLGIDNPVPAARYEFTQDSNALQLEFFDASHFAYEWSWDFGDGSDLDTTQHPVHTFSGDGTYQVCLQASNASGQDVYCEDIYVGTVSTYIEEDQQPMIRTFPNPVNAGPLTFEVEMPEGGLSFNLYLRLHNTQGQQVWEQSLSLVGKVWRTQIATETWPRGVYYYELLGPGGALSTGKIVI